MPGVPGWLAPATAATDNNETADDRLLRTIYRHMTFTLFMLHIALACTYNLSFERRFGQRKNGISPCARNVIIIPESS